MATGSAEELKAKRSFMAIATGRAKAGRRVEWVDTAKAVSILMVVAWHTFGRKSNVSPLFIFVPMPLFFFIGGFFAREAVLRPWRNLADSEGVRLLYLYVLWACITFLLVGVPKALLAGEIVPWWRLPLMFTSPFDTLWFAYALALTFFLAQVFSRVPVWITAAALAALYTVSVFKGVWFDVRFIDRLVRLTPFFFLGVLGFPWLKGAVPRFRNWWPLAMAVYFALAWTIISGGLMWAAPLTFVASLVGIAGMLMGSAWLQRFPAIPKPLNFLGASTFCVYVLHRIILFYWGFVQEALDVPMRLRGVLSAAVVIVLCLVLGALILRFTPWLFYVPWRSKRSPRPMPGLAAAH